MLESADIFYRQYSDTKCIYCFIEKEEILCKCKDCDFYFCNGINDNTEKSHIIFHLTDINHKSICLKPFKEELKCEKCKENNVFDLFYNNNNINIILCKKCLDDEKNKEEFYPFVENNNQISEKLLSKPTNEIDLRKLKNLDFDYFKKINMQIIKLKKLLDSMHLKNVRLPYESLEIYYTTYKLLINAEKQYLKAVSELKEEYEYKFYFFYDQNEDGDEFVYAEIYPKEDEEWDFFYIYRHKDFSVFSEKDRNNRIEYIAKIENINNKSVILKFPKIIYKPIDGIYYIKEKNSLYSYIRILRGLDYLYDEPDFYIDLDILDIILGKIDKNFSNENTVIDVNKIPNDLNIPEYPKLNQSQEKALLKCLRNKFTMIKGPPGTGKTYLCSVLIYHLLNLNNTNKHILLCAPSNKACDNLAYYISKLRIKFLRVLSKRREETGEKVENSLNDIIKESELGREFNRLYNKKERNGDLYGKDYKKYKKIIREKEKEIISQNQVIITTINKSFDRRIYDYEFPIVIIDECTQALEPDSILPLIHKAKYVVIIGDDKQLGPIVFNPIAAKCGLEISLFERLWILYNGDDDDNNHFNFSITLTEQYRMHPKILEFPNELFYNNKIKSGINENERLNEELINNIPFPNKKIPLLFYHLNSYEEITPNRSYKNLTEAEIIFQLIPKLIELKIEIKNIGIITPYNGQKALLRKYFESFEYLKDIQIESVDGFQGQEKDIIIVSTVRNNLYGSIGFLKSERRLNVTLTRAKYGMIILGNCECLSKKNEMWKQLINYYNKNDLIRYGDFNNLKKYNLDNNNNKDNKNIFKFFEFDFNKGLNDDDEDIDKNFVFHKFKYNDDYREIEENEEEEEEEEDDDYDFYDEYKDNNNRNRKNYNYGYNNQYYDYRNNEYYNDEYYDDEYYDDEYNYDEYYDSNYKYKDDNYNYNNNNRNNNNSENKKKKKRKKKK